MNVLIFYNYNFGIEDVKECFEKKGYKFKAVWSEQLNQRKCTELDDIFEKEFDELELEYEFIQESNAGIIEMNEIPEVDEEGFKIYKK